MASSEFFASGLNKWKATDKPQRTDFVRDNEIIDQYICNAPKAEAKLVNGTIVITPLYRAIGDLYSVQFVATFDYAPNYPVKIDGTTVTLFDLNGLALGEGWKAGDFVQIQRMGSAARVLSPLRDKATIKSPTINTLAVMNNFTVTSHDNFYYKTQENIVTISYAIAKPNAEIVAGAHQVAQLPSGFQPFTTIHSNALVFETKQPVFVWVAGDTSGIMTFDIAKSIPAGYRICGQLSYIAR